MAVQRRVNWVSQQRVDIPDLRSIESASSNDFDQYISCLTVSNLPGYVLRGFDLVMTSAIGGAASGLQMNVSNAAIFHPFASESGTYMVVPTGTPIQILNSSINTQVTGAFTPNSENFVGIDYVRAVDDATAANVYLWDPTLNAETTSVLPRAEILSFVVVISTGTWANNVLPVCTVTTDAGNNVLSIEDNRPLLFRLGTAGTSAPNPFYSYPWNAQPEGRTENPYLSTSNAVNPFQGGDKMLFTDKDEKDAIKSILKEIKGSAFWYTPGSTSAANVNLSSLFFDTDASVLTMRGKFIHSQFTPGMLTWTGQLNLRSISGPLTFIVPANNVTLLDTEVAYIYLVRDQNFQSTNVFTFVNGSATINASSLIAGIAAGDWIRFFSDTITAYQQVQNVSGSTITLVAPYIGSSASGIALRSQGSYTMQVAEPDAVPADNNAFWIAKRDDNGSITATLQAPPTGAVRSAGITTFTTTIPHGLNAGQGIQAQGVTDGSFNQFFEILTIPTTSSLTVQNPGADTTSGNGTISSTATIYLRGIGEVSQGESTSDDSSALEALLQYTGSPYAGATQPQYGNTNFVTQGIDLTDAISELDGALYIVAGNVNQDRNLKLIEGGVWAYNGITGVLSWSTPAFIQVPGQADNLNTIAAGSVTLTADQVAYVEINREGTPPLTLAVTVANASAVTLDDDTVVFARRQPTTNSVIVGTGTFAIFDGEASYVDGALSVIDDYFSELRMTAARPNNTRILVSNSDVEMLTGETRSQRISSFLLNFAGAQIDFQTGDIYEADGSTPLGIDFTPTIPAAGQWLWYTVVIIPDTLGSDNRMIGDILVLPAASSGSSADLAPRSIFTGSGIALGQIVITSSDGSTVTPITQANIVQLGVGSGSGSGSGSLTKVNLYDGIDTTLPTSNPVIIDGVTVTDGMTSVFTQLGSGNNEVYEYQSVGGGSTPDFPNNILLQSSNANPYADGNLESIVNSGNVATPQAANDAYFIINSISGSSAITENTGGVTSVSSTATGNWYAQGFQFTGQEGSIASVVLNMSFTGTAPSGTASISIYTDNGLGTAPSATLVEQSFPTNMSILTGSQSPVTFTFTTVGFPLYTPGTQYWLVTDFAATTFGAGTTINIASETPSTYALGSQVSTTNSGGTWSGVTGNALNFILNGTYDAGSTGAYTTAVSIPNDTYLLQQPFLAAATGSLSVLAVVIQATGSGSATGNVYAELYTNVGDQPGTLIATSAPLAASTIAIGYNQYNFSFSSGSMVSGTDYCVVLDFTGVTFSGGIGFNVGSLTGGHAFAQTSTTGPTGPWTNISSGTNIFFYAGVSGLVSEILAENTSVNTTAAETENTTSLGQTFTSTATGLLTSAVFQLSIATASPANSGNLTVKIYTDNAGQPDTLIETSSTLDSSTLTTTPTAYTFNFSNTNTLNSGDVYHAILDTSGLSGTSTPGTVTWTPQPVFASPYTPEDGDMLVITQGTEFANQVTLFNGTTWVVNDIVRHFNGVDFWEETAIISSTLSNNTTGTIFSVTALGSENMVINFSILRNGNKETGTLYLTNNGTTAEVVSESAYTAETGIDFSAAIVSGNVQLNYTADASGDNATFKYIIRRWSDGGAGPTGTPSYSPVLPGGVTNSAFTMSDGSSTPYNCSSPFNVSSMTNITLDFPYTVGVNGGTTVGALDVYVSGIRIQRFVSSAITPPSGGTYYTEVSSTQIQFNANIMTSPLTVEIILRS